jgi:hypothetical protein
MLLASVAVVSARGERELTDDELRAEMSRNRALAAYVARNGDPDMAESHFLADVPPWDDHEVTLYYLEARKEIGFARAWILGRPDIQLERYERPLTDEQIAALAARVKRAPAPPAHTEDVPRMSAPAPTDEAPRLTPAAAHVTEEAAPASTAGTPPSGDASPTAGAKPMSPDERAEAAAQRAEDVAARLETMADSAEHAADRADAVTADVHTAFQQNLQ